MKEKKYRLVISIIVFGLIFGFSIYLCLIRHSINNFKLIFIILAILNVMAMLSVVNEIKLKKNFNILNSIMVVVFALGVIYFIKTTNVQLNNNLIPSFIGKNYSEVVKWAKDNKIELIENYEYSDSYDEFIVFAQDPINVSVKDISTLGITISSGFNTEKKVILPSFVGQDIEEFTKEMDLLHLSNVKIDYQVNEFNNRNIIISQSKSGEIRRSDEVKLVVSLGKKSELADVTMIDLVGKELFDATLFLEQNALNYEIAYEFSSSPLNTVIKQSISEGSTVKPFSDKVVVTVSKGKVIKVPNLLSMTVDEVIAWITNNNLKIELKDEYNSSIASGKVIRANYKENDEIAENTLVKITTSKGPLKMLKFKSLSEFRTWANNYNIKYDEDYEFSGSVPKGSIIKFSHSAGDLIDISDIIIVTISNGKPITIPNYVGKKKSEIISSCKNIGLSCSFTYGSYSTKPLDTATAQNKKAGSSVINGTSLVITLSRGPAKTFTVEISESQLSIGNASATAATLKSYLTKKYPGVTFNFSFLASNVYSRPGFIHEKSEVTDGKKVTQGKSYKVIITK